MSKAREFGNGPGFGKCPAARRHKCPTPRTNKAGKCPAVARGMGRGGGGVKGAGCSWN